MATPQIIEKASAAETTVRNFFATLDREQGIPTQLVAPNLSFTFNSDAPTDLAGWQGLARSWFTAFPGSKHVVESVIANGDRIAVRCRATGIQKGPLGDFPASNKPINIVGNILFTLREGKVARVETVWDMQTLMQQVGAIPKPAK